MAAVLLKIHYHNRVSGWLHRLQYPDATNPIFDIRAPRSVLSRDTCSFELRASSNTFLVEGRPFAYNDLNSDDKIPKKDWITEWYAFSMLPKEIAKLVNHLWRLDWEDETIAIELMHQWMLGRVAPGDITEVMISRLHARIGAPQEE